MRGTLFLKGFRIVTTIVSFHPSAESERLKRDGEEYGRDFRKEG